MRRKDHEQQRYLERCGLWVRKILVSRSQITILFWLCWSGYTRLTRYNGKEYLKCNPKIDMDMGTTGSLKIGDQGCHNEDKVTSVESNLRKLAVSRSQPTGQRKWCAGYARLNLQPNPHPPQKSKRQTMTSDIYKPKMRSRKGALLDNNTKL